MPMKPIVEPKSQIVEPKSQIAPKPLDDAELDITELATVSGGTLQSALSNAIKSIGEGLSAMARKG